MSLSRLRCEYILLGDRPATGRTRLAAAILALALLAAFWSPCVLSPYWQDDFGCLVQARNEAMEGRSWFASFASPSDACFWRPLSVGFCWRLVYSLGGDARMAHGLNLLLMLASSAAVGRLTATWLKLRYPDIDAARGGLFAMLFYGLHNARFLPTAWACCSQDLLLVLFSALCLDAWLRAIVGNHRRDRLAAAAVLPLAAAALLCKETAVILPCLAAIVTLWIEPRNGQWLRAGVLGGLLVALTVCWWWLHQRMTAPVPDAYRMQWDATLVRNAACLGLFMLNMPREAIRFLLENHSAIIAAWGVVCFLLTTVGCAMLVRRIRYRIGRRDMFCFLGLILLGFGPHLPLAQNCYEYYTSPSLWAIAFLVGAASIPSRAFRVAMLLVVLGSVLAVLGNYALPYPSLWARARWGQRQLAIVHAMQADCPEGFAKPIYLRVEDEHRFQAFGRLGLAWTLHCQNEDFVTLPPNDRPPTPSPVLVIPASGDVYWEHPQAPSPAMGRGFILGPMTREPILQSAPDHDDDRDLRPQRMQDMVGQRDVYARLKIAVGAAAKRAEPLGHVLFDGPPGLGKTTFAMCIPRDLGVSCQVASGAALAAPKDLIPYLTNAEERSVLFIDEIHRLPKTVEEFLYPAMEDFRVDITLGEGVNARTLNMRLKPFTLIGATTRTGLLSAPLRDRFQMREHLDFYTVEELAEIVSRNAKKLRVDIVDEAAMEIAGRSRSTPRLANNRLRWVRDYAQAKADGVITLSVARDALKMQGIDPLGLDPQDRKYLETIARVFAGGPVGVEAVAHTMNVAPDTLIDEVEPFLLRSELVVRTPRGRRLTSAAFDHLGLLPADSGEGPGQRSLFA